MDNNLGFLLSSDECKIKNPDFYDYMTTVKPDYSNVCTEDFTPNGHRSNMYEVPRSCVLADTFNAPSRDGIEVCQNMNAESGEWTGGENAGKGQDPDNTCFITRCNEGKLLDLSNFNSPERNCTSGGINCKVTNRNRPGGDYMHATSVVCTRNLYTGETLKCCTNDYNYIGPRIMSKDRCFSDKEKRHTCAPINRDITTASCFTQLTDNFCDLAPRSWNNLPTLNRVKERLPGYICQHFFKRYLYGNYIEEGIDRDWDANKGVPSYKLESRERFNNLKGFFNRILTKYRDAGFEVGAPVGSSAYDEVLDQFFTSMAKRVPGLLDDYLSNLCENETLNSISINPDKAKVCGCYLPDLEYDRYISQFGLTKSCAPSCNRTNVIHNVKQDKVTEDICRISSCIIDDVTINLHNSSVGEVNFNQICNSCGSGQGGNSKCSCIMSGINLNIFESQIDNINLTQDCQGSLECFSPNGRLIDCRLGTFINEGIIRDDEEISRITRQTATTSISISGIILGAVLLSLLIYAFVR